MEQLNNTILIAALTLGFVGCGVKGRPLPPLNPAPLGRGEPTYKEAQSSQDKKKNPLKKNIDAEADGAETEEP